MLVSSFLLLAAMVSATGTRSRHRNIARAAAASASSTSSFLDKDAPVGGYKIIGNSGVSAQMMFVGTKDTVYILDKAENNSMTITTNGKTHPAWATKFDLRTNQVTPMEVSSNTFCAAGVPTANGSWAVFGGNQPVTYKGDAVSDKVKNPSGTNPYMNTDGGQAVRLITPCDDESCQWSEGGPDFTMQSKRWYPTTETLGDGSVIILGGDFYGGYVATKEQNNPTYEYWPKRPEGEIRMDFLDYTLPLSLYPLTWLMPSGKLFLQANYKSILYDMDTKKETQLQDMPYAARVYPASAAAVMLPLTPANNYTAEILFCGGSAAPLQNTTDAGAGFNITAVRADDSCVRIRPDDPNPKYEDDDSLPEARSMGQLIYLPDGTMWLGNGVEYGTAGYGDDNGGKGWSIGTSYGQVPLYTPAIYDPNAPAGKRFNRQGLSDTTEERMYHSSAVLVADGSVLVSGSNPNADVTFTQWPTVYTVEKWYPPWYNQPRPTHSGFPTSLSYGGPAWNLTLTNKAVDPSKIKISVIRTGFSTHCMNMGQRYLELETSYKMDETTGEITIFASQMPPNPNLFAPGPAMIFLVVDGIPSEGEMVIIGSGQMGQQPVSEAAVLPAPVVIQAAAENKTQTSTGSTTQKTSIADSKIEQNAKSSASSLASPILAMAVGVLGAVAWM